MQPPDALIKAGIIELPTIGDGRQSGTSGSPSILNASPESAAGSDLALIETGDRVRIDLNNTRVNLLPSDPELAYRRKPYTPHALEPIPPHQDLNPVSGVPHTPGPALATAPHKPH